MSELDIKQFVFKKGAARRIPVSGTFELTSRCNLSCKMCYVHMTPQEQDQVGRELSTEEWLRLGREAVDKGMIYLLLTGGEPFLRPDFVELYTQLIKMGLLISINTNATLLTPEILECFKKHRPEKVNVTLYGSSDCTYGSLCGNSRGYEAAKRNILAMKEAGIRVNLNTTFTRLNIQDMEQIVEFAKEHQIPVRMSAYIFPPVRTIHETEDVNLTPEEMGRAAAWFDWITLEEDKRLGRAELIRKCLSSEVTPETNQKSRISSCMAGRGAFWVTWDGKMYPCGMLSDFSVDVQGRPFEEAWKETCRWVATMYLPEECLTCKYQSLCPSCAAVFQCENQATDKVATALCQRTKAYAEAFLQYAGM